MYKSAVSRFPDFMRNTELTDKMKAVFVANLNSDPKTESSIFETLAVYQEFKELVPVGVEGEDLTLKLADKLSMLDLLGESSKIMEDILLNKEAGPKRAEIGTKAAILYFMNKEPRKAIDVIKKTDFDQIPSYLKDERQIITARSLLALGEYDSALISAGNMDPEEEARVRAEVAWKKSDWVALVESHKNIENKGPEDVIKLAIANSILNNQTNLKLLRSKYGDEMKKSAYAQEFEYVSSTENIDYRNLASSLKLDETAKLINKYKEKIKKGGVNNLTAKKQ